jgi:CBS-domain-containing membrane protein
MWVLSYIGANWALILVVVLAVVALGAVAWLAKNWKVAVAAIIVLAVAFAYQQIDKNAYQRRVSLEVAEKVAALQRRLDAVNQINQKNAERALDDAAEIARLQAEAGNTPANASACFDSDTAGRVSRIR